MKIPVFVSSPTKLSRRQVTARNQVTEQLESLGMEPRALGVTDYPSDFPLREVLVIARHCSGGIILGFEQLHVTAGTHKRGTGKRNERPVDDPLSVPTPWNHLEAGILFAVGLPLLVFREESVRGGVFDDGVTDLFIHRMPLGSLSKADEYSLRDVFLNWQRKVRAHYYSDGT